ncbi:hypothetical protein [Hyalangium gracile]|uniref:hypothetical protein n=1 Tax=Hyalangium gracile TaxID=394092 RepID=UPI001CCBB05E|nr:hypothetical protein [Hyalangium gracile]
MLPLLSSCNLIDVADSEQTTSGRGAKVFDPYQASNSGAIRLSLQYINGCAWTPNGGFISKNSMNIPYPTVCDDPDPLVGSVFAETTPKVPPRSKLYLLSNTTYFLNQFAVTDVITGKHRNPADLTDSIQWMKTQSRFKNLDWSGLGQVQDEWTFNKGYPQAFADSWSRSVYFDNAAWRRVKDDTFLIEVLDVDGTVRASQTYSREDFMVESPYSGHSRIAWSMGGVLPPLYPGDNTIRPVEPKPGMLPGGAGFRSIVRMDMFGSTNPFKTFKTPDLRGDGAIKVTWSQLPGEPFFFPVTFLAHSDSQSDLPTNCYDDANNPRACGFGLEPSVTFVTPANGKFYVPGETLNAFIEFKDNDGNRLHSTEEMPNGPEIFSDQATGLLAVWSNFFNNITEQDNVADLVIGGPLQNFKVNSDVLGGSPDYYKPDFSFPIFENGITTHLVPTLWTYKRSTRYAIEIPADAKPGTYVAFLKATRYWMGERVSRNQPFFFQVGQEELTTYPARVGNCQICHRGVLSLDNLRHGLSVDHVEGCKVCHDSESDGDARTQEIIHRIHMRSPKYPMAKNDCTVCHLVKESAVRPSITTCRTCHPSLHDNQYWQAAFTQRGEPNRYGNCAQACHAESSTPKAHILPDN